VPEDDASRRLILARRARFVAAALASAGIAAACSDYDNGGQTERSNADGSSTSIDERRPAEPSIQIGDAGTTGDADEPDRGVLIDATAVDASDSDAEPQPCLTPY
jgi:hypothetical protein